MQLEKLSLFAGTEDMQKSLESLDPQRGEYARGARILSAGERCRRIGILLSGGADIVREDAGGNPVTVAHIGEGEMFAEAFACSGEPLTVSAVATLPSRVLWLSAERLLSGADAKVTANALRLFARKNLYLNQRIEHLSRRTLEEKVLSYLRSVRRAAKSDTFSVPFDRQGLADFLGCDRSALSAVLSKLKARGVLDYHKSAFRLF